MPVLITGADTGLGAGVVAQLRPTGGELRAYVDATTATEDDAARLRAAGCKVAVGELDDEAHLEAALEQVHTVAHCWTGPLHDPGAQVEAAATLSSAALGAGVRRLIWVRELARAPHNPYLAALSEIQELFDALPVEVVTLSTGLRHGPGDAFTERLRRGWLCGSGVAAGAVHAPVAIGDVARAVAAADRQRGTRRELHVALTVLGPHEHTLGETLARLGAPPLDAPPPPELPPPADWVVDWLSRASGRQALVAGATVAHGAAPVA